jgi:phenol/toluene 2-monooxygenase (NADH) P0/A0
VAFDPTKKFVRVAELRKDGFVEFDFAVGEPEVFVEMILPATAFDEFCAHNHVTFLDDERRVSPGDSDERGWEWSLRDAVHQRLK